MHYDDSIILVPGPLQYKDVGRQEERTIFNMLAADGWTALLNAL